MSYEEIKPEQGFITVQYSTIAKELSGALPSWVIDDYNNAIPHQRELIRLNCHEPNLNVSSAILLTLIVFSVVFFTELVAFFTGEFTSFIEGLSGLFFCSISLLFIFDVWINLSYPSRLRKLEKFTDSHNINLDRRGVQMVIQRVDLTKYLALKDKNESELTIDDWKTLAYMYQQDYVVSSDWNKFSFCLKTAEKLKQEKLSRCVCVENNV